MNYTTGNGGTLNQSIMSGNGEGAYGRVAGKRPTARDGHSGVIFSDYLFVFGGDRHHMPFNDLYMIDLRKEFL